MQATDQISPVAQRVAAVIVSLLLWSGECLAQPQSSSRRPLIADVIVTGNQRMPTESIMRQLRTRAGNYYNADTVQEDVRQLMNTKQFGNVQASLTNLPDGRVNVYFMIVDYPGVIEEIVYQGAKKLKPDELETLTGLRKGAAMNPVANKIACQAIVRRYNEKGRPFASCSLLEGINPGDRRVVFNITEGPEVYIKDIRFTGNQWASDGILKTHIMSSEKFLGISLFSKPYNAALVDVDVDKLREYYRSFGFHDVKVGRELVWEKDNENVTLVFHIDEGLRYRLKETPQLDGVKNYDPSEIQRLVDIHAGDYYNQGNIDRDANKIKEYYGYDGRDVRVQDRVVYTGAGQCALHLEVSERPPARVGQIFVVGNEITRQNVILRQVPLYPGQLLAYPELRAAERNLSRLNLFETNGETGVRPTVTVMDPDSDSEFKDILVSVQEARTGSLLFGVGVNSDAGLTGSIVLNERNFDLFRVPTSFEDLLSGHAFRGAGQELRIEAVPGTQLQRYTMSFREPYLFDSQYGLTVGAYYYTRQFNEYTETRLGSRVTLSRRFGQYWTASATSRIEQVGVFNVPTYAPNDILQAQGENFLLGLRAGLTRDSRDSFLRPTEGSIVDMSFEQVLGDQSFPLFTFDVNKYLTVYERADGTGRHVLAMHSQVGLAGGNTPIYERYYGGGFRSIRGFQFRGVGPDVNGFKIGGDFLFLNSLEYQVPVKANDSIFLVGFVDSGTDEPTVELKNYRVTAGFGVRFVVPMLGPVPIALDFGFPIVKAQSDNTQVFSFWLGFFR